MIYNYGSPFLRALSSQLFSVVLVIHYYIFLDITSHRLHPHTCTSTKSCRSMGLPNLPNFHLRQAYYNSFLCFTYFKYSRSQTQYSEKCIATHHSRAQFAPTSCDSRFMPSSTSDIHISVTRRLISPLYSESMGFSLPQILCN